MKNTWNRHSTNPIAIYTWNMGYQLMFEPFIYLFNVRIKCHHALDALSGIKDTKSVKHGPTFRVHIIMESLCTRGIVLHDWFCQILKSTFGLVREIMAPCLDPDNISHLLYRHYISRWVMLTDFLLMNHHTGNGTIIHKNLLSNSWV